MIKNTFSFWVILFLTQTSLLKAQRPEAIKFIGNAKLELRNSQGCNGAEAGTFKLNGAPSNSSNNIKFLCPGDTIILTHDGNYKFVDPTPATQPGIGYVYSKFSGKEKLNYTVCFPECSNACKTSTIEFVVESPCNDKTNLKLPNIIFPNASGINRYFHVEAIEKCPDAFGPKPSSLKVFNRWGDLVYSSPEYKNDWDGENNKGQPLPDGTYYYLLDMGSQGGPVKGWVVIMR